MAQEGAIFNLLDDVIKDNPTFKFPVEDIRQELNQMLTNQIEFDYFFRQAYTKIKSNYSSAFLFTFVNTCEMILKISNNDFYDMTEIEYQMKIDELITTLEALKITRIEKDSPDGEMMSIMT